MLVLGRKENESIIITVAGRKIEVMVTDIRGHSVRLGVTAGSDIKINRKEVDHKPPKNSSM